jgi:hypothetical protein
VPLSRNLYRLAARRSSVADVYLDSESAGLLREISANPLVQPDKSRLGGVFGFRNNFFSTIVFA